MTAILAAPRYTFAEWRSIVRDPTRDNKHLATRLWPDARDYLAWKRLSNAAARTLQSEEYSLAVLARSIDPVGVQDVTVEHLITALDTIPSGSWRKTRSHWRTFFQWAILHDRRGAKNPVDLLPKLLRQNRVPVYKVFNAFERQAIITATRQSLDPARDRVRVHLLLDGGLRASEATGLLLDDVDPQSRSVTVRGKGDKERLVLIAEGEFWTAWDDYLLTPYPKLDRGPAFGDHVWFPMRVAGAYRNRVEQVTASYPEKQLVYSGFWGWWKKRLEAAGVAYRKPHMTRHTYATDALDATQGDLYGVKEQLGHSSTVVTEIYLHSSRRRSQHVADRLAAFRREETEV